MCTLLHAILISGRDTTYTMAANSWDLPPNSLQSHKRCKVPVTNIWHTVDSLYCYCAALGSSEALDEKAVREGIMGVH